MTRTNVVTNGPDATEFVANPDAKIGLAETHNRVLRAFRTLRKMGLFAEMSISRELANIMVLQQNETDYVFYECEDEPDFREHGVLYIQWGSPKMGKDHSMRLGYTVFGALAAQGLRVEWDGSICTGIMVRADVEVA